MKIRSSTKSIRKALAESLEIAAKQAEERTIKKLNTLPEYFINMKIADAIFERFPTSYSYSLEDSLQSICQEIELKEDTLEKIEPGFRLTGSTRADLVLRSKRGKIRHLVEIKRGLKGVHLEKDALRLAAICFHAPLKHRIEKNFLLAISTLKPEKFLERTTSIVSTLDSHELNGVSVHFEPIDLSFHTSGRKSSHKKPLFGGIWQFERKSA